MAGRHPARLYYVAGFHFHINKGIVMIRGIHIIALAVTLAVSVKAAGTYSDPLSGYSIYLPDNWVHEAVSATQHRFFDTTAVYQSMISLVTYDFADDTLFTASGEWTRANFIAYIFSIDADPLCALVFYDSVTAVQNEDLWAADAYTEFFSYDSTIGDWAEYIRFTASGKTGYEIYALGPIEDMNANVGYYAAMIESITLPTTDSAIAGVVPRAVSRTMRPVIAPAQVSHFDLLGRRIEGHALQGVTNIRVMNGVRTFIVR